MAIGKFGLLGIGFLEIACHKGNWQLQTVLLPGQYIVVLCSVHSPYSKRGIAFTPTMKPRTRNPRARWQSVSRGPWGRRKGKPLRIDRSPVARDLGPRIVIIWLVKVDQVIILALDSPIMVAVSCNFVLPGQPPTTYHPAPTRELKLVSLFSRWVDVFHAYAG